MKALIIKAGAAIGMVLALGGASAAQAETASQMAANRRLILEFYRQVFEPQDVTRAKDFVAVDMIEHNPNVGQGLKGFVDGFGPRWKPRPVEAKLRSPPAETVTDGDLVQLVFKRPRPDPVDPSKSYDSFWFDLFRVKNGRIVEHWDGALKPTAPR